MFCICWAEHEPWKKIKEILLAVSELLEIVHFHTDYPLTAEIRNNNIVATGKWIDIYNSVILVLDYFSLVLVIAFSSSKGPVE
jgi:hypothetical protein